MYNDSIPVLESIKLIGGKLMEQAGMIENNYLCIMAFDKLAVWGGTNIKHTSNGNAQCSLTLSENFSEAREEGEGSCSKFGETSIEEDAPHCCLARKCLTTRVQTGREQQIFRKFYIQETTKAFLPYEAHANQGPAFTFRHITLHCSHFKLFLAVQFPHLVFH